MQPNYKVTVKHSRIKLNVSEQKGVMYFTDEHHSMLLCAPIHKIKSDSEGTIYCRTSQRERWAIELDWRDYLIISEYVEKRKLEIKETIMEMSLLANLGKDTSVSTYAGDEE